MFKVKLEPVYLSFSSPIQLFLLYYIMNKSEHISDDKSMTYIPANMVNETSEIRSSSAVATRDRFSPGKTRAWVFHLVFVDSDDVFLRRAEVHTQAQQRHRRTALIQTQQSAHVLIHQTRALQKHRPCITVQLQEDYC